MKTVKFTRKETAIRKANKVQLAKYKAERQALAVDADLRNPSLPPVTSEEVHAFRKSIVLKRYSKYIDHKLAKQILDDGAYIGSENEYLVSERWDCSEEWLIDDLKWLTFSRASMLSSASQEDLIELLNLTRTLDPYYYKDKPLVSIFYAAYKYVPTKEELDILSESFVKYRAFGGELYELDTWATKHMCSVDDNYLNTVVCTRWHTRDKDHTQCDNRHYYMEGERYKDMMPTFSLLEYTKGWDYLSPRKFYSNISQHFNDEFYSTTHEEFIEWVEQGKHRMILKASKHTGDTLKLFGIPYVPCSSADKLARLLRKGIHKFSMKAAKKYPELGLDTKDPDYVKIANYVVLGEHGINLNASRHIAHLAMRVPAIPEGMKKAVAQSQQLQSLIFDEKLRVNWTLHPGSAKECAILTIMEEMEVDYDLATKIFNTPSAKYAVEFASENQPTLQCTLPAVYNLETQGYTLSRLAKDHLDNLVMGDLTGCCQKLGGAGEAVCVEGWSDKHSVNYVYKSNSGNTYAHFWAWETSEGGIVIDSIESRGCISVDVITELTLQFIDSIDSDVPLYIAATEYGVTAQVALKLREHYELLSQPCPMSKRPDKYTYLDAKHGVYLIA